MTRGNFEFLSSDFSKYMYKNYKGEFLVLFWKKMYDCSKWLSNSNICFSQWYHLWLREFTKFQNLDINITFRRNDNWHIFLERVVGQTFISLCICFYFISDIYFIMHMFPFYFRHLFHYTYVSILFQIFISMLNKYSRV